MDDAYFENCKKPVPSKPINCNELFRIIHVEIESTKQHIVQLGREGKEIEKKLDKLYEQLELKNRALAKYLGKHEALEDLRTRLTGAGFFDNI